MKRFMNFIKSIEETRAGYIIYTCKFLLLFFILFVWYMNVDLNSAPEFIYSQF